MVTAWDGWGIKRDGRLYLCSRIWSWREVLRSEINSSSNGSNGSIGKNFLP